MSQPDTLRLLIVDGHHFAYRAFYAIRSMNAPDGFPTNAIYGFIKAMERMRERVEPTHIAVIWDGGLDEERIESLEDYKAEREPMPDDMELQLDGIVQWLESTGIFTWCQDGVEADDVIGTLAWQAEAVGFTIVIASSDKDFFQLINPNISMLNPNDKSGNLWGDSQVEAKTGVLPHQIIDWLSLMGDSVDGIPGVQGVGPKTAAKLLSEFGAVDAIYEKLDSIASEKLRNRLADAENDVRRNQQLVGLKKIPEWNESLSDLRPKPRNVTALEGLYRKWNFRSKLEELGEFPF